MAGCPSDEIMAALSEGQLDAAATALVHAHVDTCQSCQWLLRELAGAAPPLASAETVAGHGAGDAAAKPSLRSYVAGAIVGERYRLDRLIGTGGMGTVWAATHLGTDRTVALKLLRVERTTTPAARLRFLREARLLGRVEHKHLVPVHDVFDDEGTPVLVMEFLAGESLGERLRRDTKLDPDELVRLIVPAMAAVHAAHAEGIVHRDLKPDNLFLVEIAPGEHALRVLDFGIAKLLEASADVDAPKTLTEAGEVLGTPPYMAPEQLRGESIDRRVDVWAFGVILYQCLSGQRPFVGTRIGQYFDKITKGLREPLAKVAPGAPPHVIDLVERMLTVDRDARTNDLGEAIRVLSKPPAVDKPLSEAARYPWIAPAIVTAISAIAALTWSFWPRRPVVAPITAPITAPAPSPAACTTYWPIALHGTLCEAPLLAMREAAYRHWRSLRGDGPRPDPDLLTDLLACDRDDGCLLGALQAASRRVSVIDCKKAVSFDARTICKQTALADRAGTLAGHYQALLDRYADNAPRLQKLSQEQTAWLTVRHKCGADEGCLATTLDKRIAELAEIHKTF